MKVGDGVWILRRDGEWRRGVVRAIGSVYVTVDVTGYVAGDHYPADELDAMQALRAATEAVAKARDAVVDAARAAAGRWGSTPWVPYDEGDSGDITDAVRRLIEADRAEAEARAALEALR